MRELKFRAWDGKSVSPISGYGSANDGTFHLDEEAVGSVWMQYTGLKDKNGAEIYEGDIIESTWNGRRFDVKWEEGGFEWFSDCDSNLNKWNYRYGGTEVIGNIYENPELLK